MESLIEGLDNLDISREGQFTLEMIIQTQALIRGFLVRKNLMKSRDKINLELVEKILDNYIQTHFLYKRINKDLSKKKIRNPNFPSEISENIVKFVIAGKYKIMPCWDIDSGDLILLNKRVEVKGFMSTGPSSFGPTEKWDMIYFVDATEFSKKKFKVYEIFLSNDCKTWSSIRVNKAQTYENQCKQGRRPRISFNEIKKQIPENCKLIFDGSFAKLKNF